MGVQLRVNTPQGGTSKVIDLCDSEAQLKKITVMQLKEKISEQLLITGDFRIVFRTEPMEESKVLSSFGIQHMSTIHTVLMLPGGF